MGEQAFTPGPWLVQDEFNGEWSVWTRQPHPGTLCIVRDEDVNGVFPAKANARLIAAAPDLYAAAEAVLKAKDEIEAYLRVGFPARSLLVEPDRKAAEAAFVALRAALAKATAGAE